MGDRSKVRLGQGGGEEADWLTHTRESNGKAQHGGQ